LTDSESRAVVRELKVTDVPRTDLLDEEKKVSDSVVKEK